MKKKSLYLTVSQTINDEYLPHCPAIPLHEGMGTTNLNLNQQSNDRITLTMGKNNDNQKKKKIPPHCSQAFFDGNPKYLLFTFFEGVLQTAFHPVRSFHQTFRDLPQIHTRSLVLWFVSLVFFSRDSETD